MNALDFALLAQMDAANDAVGDAVASGVGLFGSLVGLAIAVLIIAGFWKTFEKAGEPGGASLIPIYNGIVLLRIAGRPIWWVLLFLIPCVGFIIAIIVALDVAKSFGLGAGFGLGLAFLPMIFYPVLGFGGARYVGPAAQSMGA